MTVEAKHNHGMKEGARFRAAVRVLATDSEGEVTKVLVGGRVYNFSPEETSERNKANDESLQRD